jgi:hypothetical protein
MDGTETEQYQGNYAHIVGSSDDKCPRKKMMGAALKSYQTNGYDIQELEIGKLYGSFEKGNACIYVEIPNQIHEGAFVNSDHIEALLDFAMKSVEPVNYIAPSEQIWVVKDFTGLAGMVAFVISMILFALMLTEKVPFFAAVRQPLPRNIGLRKVGLAISIICGLLFPFIVLRTGCFGLVSLIGGTGSSVPAHLSIFPLHFSGIALAVIVGCTILGCITMILFLLTDGKKAKATIADLGLTPANNTHIVWSFIGKSFLLAVITAALGWTYLKLQGDMLGTDFYCQFFGYKPIPAVKFGTYIGYIIVWIIAFLISSIGMNVERRLPSTGSETKDTVIAVIVNAFIAAFTVTFLLSLQNKLQIDAQGASTIWSNWGLDVTRLWGMPVGMSIGAAGQTFIYRKTGNLWLGAFLMGIICALGCVLYGQLRFGIAG